MNDQNAIMYSNRQPPSLYRNSIHLAGFGVQKNRKFLKGIWENDSIIYTGGHEQLLGAGKCFDRLDCNVSFHRQDDPDMTLERYLRDMRRGAHTGIEFGHHRFFEIRYASRQGTEDKGDQFAWLICPYTEHNFSVISEIFLGTFGRTPESFPVDEGNRMYYERLQRDYGW